MKNHKGGVARPLIALALTATQSLAQSTYEPHTFTTLAGGGGYVNPDAPASAVRLSNSAGVATDSLGNVYVADTFNHAIRKVTPAGAVTTLAGLPGTFGSTDGTSNDARFYYPDKLALDSTGNVYASDSGNNTIRKVTPQGVVTTIAGRAGSFGSANGTGSAARFDSPEGVAVDSAGNVYVADANNSTIRKVTPVGTNWVVTTLAGLPGFFGSADGTNSSARFNFAQGLAIDSTGSLYVGDTDNHTIRKVTPIGTNWVVTTLVGKPGISGSLNGTNSAARLSDPKGVGVDTAGNIYVADEPNHTIRRVTPIGTNWVVSTPAGLPQNPGSADGTGNAVRFANPYGVAVDNAGNVYVADSLNNTIRKVVPIGANWVVSTPAGLAQNPPGSEDGAVTTARFNNPSGVAVDSATNIYVADTWNHTIRKVTPGRVVTTLAGRAGSAGSIDGTGSGARFNYPSGIAVDSVGNVYVADTYNNTIRKVTRLGTNWVVTTLGGAPGIWGSANGRGSAARFSNPNGIAVDSAGNLYVADFYLNTIRKGYPPPLILNPGFTNGQFGFVLTGPAGQSVVVEYSTDLLTWLPLWTNTFTGALDFTDSQNGVFSSRFYRAHVP